MTNSPDPGHAPDPRTERRWRRRFIRASLVIGGLTFAAGVAGAWWAWNFIQVSLAPLVEQTLSKTLNRPVELGEVERVTLNGLQFDSAALPPTPTDRDRVTVDEVEVRFNLLEVLLSRRLGISVTLVRPNIFVDQTADGRWISAQITTEESDNLIKTELDTIRIRDGTIALSPSPQVSAEVEEPNAAATPSVITVQGLNGSATLLNDNQYIVYEAIGQPVNGGRFELRGETYRAPDRTNLAIQAQDIVAADVSDLLPLPLNLQAGRLAANLTVSFVPDEALSINGTARFQGATAVIANVPSRFTQANGRLRFQGQRIFLENVRTRYGEIPVQVGGSLDTQAGYDLTAQVRSATVSDVLRTFDLKVPIALQGVFAANLQLTGAIDQPVISGTATSIRPTRVDRVNFQRVAARFRVTPQQLSIARLEATPVDGGLISGSGQLKFGEQGGVVFDARARNVSGDTIARLYGANLPNLTIGRVSANAQVFGPIDNIQTIAQWQAPQATYPGRGEIRVAGTVIQLRNTQLQVAGGIVRGRGEIADGRWQAVVEASQVALSRFAPQVPGLLNGQAQLSGTLANFSPSSIRGTAQAQLTQLGGGTANVQAQALNGRWQAVVNASQVALNRFSASVPGVLNGQAQLSGSLANLSPNSIQAQAQARLTELSGGTAIVRGQVVNGRWQAVITASEVALNRFSTELRGLFSGNLQASGTLANLSPSAIRAAGEVRLSEGISLIDRPLTASIRWLGDRLQIDRATAPGFSANGFVLAQLQGTPEISGIDLNVQLQDYSLTALPVAIPRTVQLAGQADFTGRIQGTPAAPTVVGQVRLENFAVNTVIFEPVLAGDVRYAGGQGLNLDLVGQQDRIAVELDGRNRPIAFLVQSDETFAQGTTQGDRLVATVQNFPLEILNFAPAATVGLGAIGGRLSGDVSVNLATLAAEGTVAIAQPSLGYINATRDAASSLDRLTAQFRYANGEAELISAELQLDDSRYLASGSFSTRTTQFRGKVVADQGRLEDILTVLQYFDIQDFQRGLGTPTYGGAADVSPVPVGLPNATLLTQLRRFSEIEALQNQQREQAQSALIPDLSELRGAFNAEVEFAGSARSGVTANFSLLGQDWRWGDYGVSRVLIADGEFADGVLTVLPLRFAGLSYALANGQRETIEGSFLNFAGQVGGDQQSGQLQASRIPIGLLRDLFNLPIDIDGQLNASATLVGSLANPQATGEITLSDASLNNTTVQQATSFFNYGDARLNFTGRLVVAEPQPVTLSGSIPYQFPFMEVEPDSDAISLDVNVQDEGLALLNLLQNQVAWVDGQGEVRLEVRGTLRQPLATGTARFENATLTAQTLPEPLTNVSGRIQFNRSRIQVEAFQGQFTTGQVVAQGVIPIFNAADAPRNPGGSALSNPLTVSLNGLALNFKGLYNGSVNGQVLVTGTALAPVIGGDIRLSDGRVSLPNTAAAATPVAAAAETEGITSPPEFQNLQIVLGDRLLITREPLLNFVAQGDLLLNGTLDDLSPLGTIRLLSGQVNLFTTQFSLARGYEQTAVFTPRNGLDPFINVRLVTSVPEVTRTPIQSATPYAISEIRDVPPGEFGALETVRVEARVVGTASQIFQNLELSSSPARTQNEIIALLGGGFVDTLGQDPTLTIANLAGSALLTRVQNFVGNTLGLSDFRLFPTTITDDDGTATFGLAAELGVDITGNLSASVLQILTTEQPAEFGLRYRLNDQFLLRGSTNFSGESRAVLEFEDRF
jgi:translocation and assembly module TamB